jgi:hypothetical protein
VRLNGALPYTRLSISRGEGGFVTAAQSGHGLFVTGTLRLKRQRATHRRLAASNGHVRTDIGVPLWLEPPLRARTQAIGVVENGDSVTVRCPQLSQHIDLEAEVLHRS